MNQLDKQIIELNREDNCEEILRKANVKEGDILQIHPRQKYESDGLVEFVGWDEKIPIMYLMREGSHCKTIVEISVEFGDSGEPIKSYSNLFTLMHSKEEYNKRDLKLNKAGIRSW